MSPDAAPRRRPPIYRVFSQGEILLTDAASAEMAKLVENAYRDVNIAFANELSLISEELRLDVWEVIRVANHHPRVNILTPGTRRRRALHRRRPVVHRRRRTRSWLTADPHGSRDQRPQAAPRRCAGGREDRALPQPDRRLPRAWPTRPTSTTCGRARRSTSCRTSPRRCRTSTSGSPSRSSTTLPPALAGLPNVRLQRASEAIDDADIVVAAGRPRPLPVAEPIAPRGQGRLRHPGDLAMTPARGEPRPAGDGRLRHPTRGDQAGHRGPRAPAGRPYSRSSWS